MTFFIVLPTPSLSCLLVDTSQGRWYQDKSNLSDRSCPSTKGVISFLAVTLFHVFSSQLKVAGQKCSLSIKVQSPKLCPSIKTAKLKLCPNAKPKISVVNSTLCLHYNWVGAPRENHSTLPFLKYPRATHMYTQFHNNAPTCFLRCNDEARHSEQLFSECLPAALQPPKEWKRRICPKNCQNQAKAKSSVGILNSKD